MDTKTRVRSNDGIDGKDSVGLYLESIAKNSPMNKKPNNLFSNSR